MANVNSDSDQSISDAEEFDRVVDGCSFVERVERGECLQLYSRLDVLLGAGKYSNVRGDTNANEDVEIPDFCEELGSTTLSTSKEMGAFYKDAIIRDEEDASFQKILHVPNTNESDTDGPVMMSSSLEALLHANSIAESTASALPELKRKAYKFNKNSKSSVNLLSDGELSRSYSSVGLMEFHGKHKSAEGNPQFVPGDVEASEFFGNQSTATKTLDLYQNKNLLKSENTKLHEKYIDYEGKSELLTIESSIEECEAEHQESKLCIPVRKTQTMADQLDEAFSDSTLNSTTSLVLASNKSCVNIFGKLQQVIQTEKERDIEFLEKLQNGFEFNDTQRSFIVKVQSKKLEGKLTVCHCSLSENNVGSGNLWTSEDRERVVIFNPRVCDGIDLDAGNHIEIHFPWKEFELFRHRRKIFLATYYSRC